MFHHLKNDDAHLSFLNLGKFNFQTNFIPNRLGKYISFSLVNKLVFNDSFQFLNSLLDILVKNLGKNDLKYFNQQFQSEVLDLVKQKLFYPYECMYNFGKFNERLSEKN